MLKSFYKPKIENYFFEKLNKNKNLYIVYMEKYIDLLRVIIKNFNIDNNPEFDDIIKKI